MLDPIKVLIEQILGLIKPILDLLPESWRDPAAAIFAIVLLIVVLVGIAQRLIVWAESTWKQLPLPRKTPPTTAKPADIAAPIAPAAVRFRDRDLRPERHRAWSAEGSGQ